ncbi:bifunctional 3,4-dihydroxy-2-butanone-4-phosphate synthase/GTP cyclohydrolase II [Gordonia sp. zg691]|uniref:bifunctional 3,4-dihydroxy-2-butanone-4-phosphate synthase/GTP cyclohydrolase II n=1 Tax=Gordonia jinghuaiqii TaxID=2758710 RepID=UPI0016623E95|nr:bifunctional 3,4-dihydroxy-2-butanone-4-phosphate synthase/GTP cyclohydrolase II [Gordonia jinghuaiqii]MBD0862010.1 bifunctional 3,4-dihydroxy-2-butanone-4-phosphate synthase/GTP cyclohydrolase II [Gordonia jinghuaiqii]
MTNTTPTPIGTEASTQSVARAVAAIAAGGFVVVVDDDDRENEGDLIASAASITDEQMSFLVRHTTGIICAPMTAERARRLDLPQMVADNRDAHGTAFTVTVDHHDAGTGVSAHDRALTVRALAADDTAATDLRRPGHVFPLQAREGGVLTRAGHTEAAVDLVTMAGAGDVGVIGEIIAEDGSMRRGEDLLAFAAHHGLPVLRIADLVAHRAAAGTFVRQIATAAMPTLFGDFRAVAYRSDIDDTEHLALVMGDVAAAGASGEGALVRVHSECLTGDIVGSLRCDCGAQLEQALAAIAEEGCGAVVYLRGHEGRGIGLGHKIRAYALQEQGLDTVDANTALGLPVDSRTYGTGAAIISDLGIRRVRLITNNPAKYGGLGGHDLEIVGRVVMPTVPTPHNVRYLRTKQERMGHVLHGDALAETSGA